MPHRRASALPPQCHFTTAVPKYISGRTSYFQVRLKFHRLPQVIPTFCNRSGFGPPRTYSARFTLLMVRSPGFGSPACDYIALSDSLSLRLHLYSGLTSPHTTTRWLILQKARRHPARRLRPAGSTWFQDLFHSPSRGSFHRSLTVLVHYRSLAVFSLGMWSSLLPTGFRVSGGTHVQISSSGQASATGLSPSSDGSSNTVRLTYLRLWTLKSMSQIDVQPPRSSGSYLIRCSGFGLLPFRSPLLRESSLFLGVR